MAQQPIQHIITIDKNVVNEMPVVTYEGQIHIIDSVSQVAGAVRALRQAPIVGFDTETRPSFKRGEMHKVSLMQLSTLTHCFLFRLSDHRQLRHTHRRLCVRWLQRLDERDHPQAAVQVTRPLWGFQ